MAHASCFGERERLRPLGKSQFLGVEKFCLVSQAGFELPAPKQKTTCLKGSDYVHGYLYTLPVNLAFWRNA